MTTAEGGFVTTNDDRLADWLRLYRNQGMRAALPVRDPRLQLPADRHRAAIGLVQFDKLERNTAVAARRSPRATTRASAGCRSASPVTPDGRTHVFHQYTIDVGAARDAILADLAEQGVGRTSTTRCPSIARNTSWSAASTPTCRSPMRAAERTLALPMFPGLTDEEQDHGDRRRSGRPSSADLPRRRAAEAAAPRRRPMTAPRAAGSTRAGRPRRPRVDGPQPPARSSSRGRMSGSSAVADPVAEALAAAAAETGAQPFAEPLAMIAEAELDALVIAAPTTAHVPLALAAIERGVPVLVEKPLAATVDEGMQIVPRPRGSAASRSRSATSSGSTRPCSSSAGCSRRAG